ncbi:BnaA09g15270D [Brassica napus]|uniref:BnaA09g15270D protein n=1 Tax=Brassica napus TaxID=3708 RepID=A0A078HWB8_BRANA|nr:BnaA09g15270D [Brassica napus]
MGEELHLLQLDLGTNVNQTNKIFKKIAAAADAGSCSNQTNSTTVLDLSKNKLLRRNPNFFRQSQEPEAFEPLTKRHLWIDPTQLSELDVLDLSNNKLSGERSNILLMYAVGYFRDSPPRRSPKNRGFKSVDYLQSRIPC